MPQSPPLTVDRLFAIADQLLRQEQLQLQQPSHSHSYQEQKEDESECCDNRDKDKGGNPGSVSQPLSQTQPQTEVESEAKADSESKKHPPLKRPQSFIDDNDVSPNALPSPSRSSHHDPGIVVLADTGDSLFGSLNIHIGPKMMNCFLSPAFYLTMGYAIPAGTCASRCVFKSFCLSLCVSMSLSVSLWYIH